MGFFTDKLNEENAPDTPPVSAPVAPPVQDTEPATKGYFSKQLETQQADEAKSQQVTGDTPWTGSEHPIRDVIGLANPATMVPSAISLFKDKNSVLGHAAKNFLPDIPRTVVETAGDIGHLLTQPVQVGKDLANADWGKVGSQLKHDYGTEEGWKQAIAERPFSRALDVGSLLYAPELAADKVGATALAKGLKAAQPANALVQAGRKTVLGADNLLNHVVGHFGTYTGGETLNIIRDAAFEGGKQSEAALKAMAGTERATKVVDDLRGAVKGMQQEKVNGYKADKAALATDKQRLDMKPIRNALDQADRDFHDPFAPVQDETAGMRQHLRGLVNRWEQAAGQYDLANRGAKFKMTGQPGGFGPNPLLDPIGMDTLKQELNTVVERASPGSKSHAVASRIRDAIADEIKTNSPIYHGMMERYGTASDAINELRSELNLGSKGNPNVALRKLLSALKNNALSGGLARRQLLDEVVKRPGMETVMPRLAGQVHSSVWPRTLAGSFMSSMLGEGALYGLLKHFTPLGTAGAIATVPAHLGMSSPKLMGRFAHAQGTMGRHLSKIPARPFIYAGRAASSFGNQEPE